MLFVRPILRSLLAVVLSVPILGTTPVSAAQLTASWIDNSGGQAPFRIERRTQSDAGFTMLANVPAGVTTYVDATVAEGVTYCYRVRAYNGLAESPYSDMVCGVAAPSAYMLTVTKSGVGAGTVASNPAGISCGIDCTEVYSTGRVVTLAATPAVGSRFDGWAGGCTGTAPCTIAANGAVTVTAMFSVVPAARAPKPAAAVVASASVAPTPLPVSPAPVATAAADMSTTTTTTTPNTSLLASVQDFVRASAPYRILAQLRDYLDPLFTPFATAVPAESMSDRAAPPTTLPTTASLIPARTSETVIVFPPSTPPQATPPPTWAPQAQSTESGKVSHRLVARVTERTWISVRMSDGRVMHESVRPGAILQWISNGRFSISVGNAGAVSFEVNGRPLAPLGAPGTAVSGVVLPPEPANPQ